MIRINEYIDHTLLKQEASYKQIKKLCEEAIEYKFKSVCVNPCRVLQAYNIVKNTDVLVCAVTGFPLGAATTNSKCAEACEAIENGANEIDMVINIGAVKDKDWEYVKNDIRSVVEGINERAVLKVILETCLLSENEIEKACLICLEAGADFVKTSTGFSKGGALIDDIKLMRKTVGDNMGVKASGGVSDYNKAVAMIEAGASRIGTSAGVSIMEEIFKYG